MDVSKDLSWGGSRFWRGVLRVADPKITLASVASMVLGAALAIHDARSLGEIRWAALALSFVGIFCLEAAKNASGELVDWDSGTDVRVTEEDRSPFSGGKRVLVDGLWTRAQTAVVAAVFYALTLGIGLHLAAREPRVLALGFAGGALAFFYHAPPVRLSYRGLGELAVFVCYGPLTLAGTYLVARGELTPRAFLLSIPLGLQIGAFLFINEFPDAIADAASGKRTLVVRLGKRAASKAFVLFPVFAFGLLALLPWIGGLPRAVWLGFAGLPFAALAAARLAKRYARTRDVIPAQALTLASFVAMSIGASAGLLVTR